MPLHCHCVCLGVKGELFGWEKRGEKLGRKEEREKGQGSFLFLTTKQSLKETNMHVCFFN
jgi:hypothetical protein